MTDPGPTVLIVEDDQNLSLLVLEVVQLNGGIGIVVADAQAALAALHENSQIRILLADLGLGAGMDGLDLVRATQAMGRNIRCVLMSGNVRGLNFDGLDPAPVLLSKPFGVRDLAAVLFPY